jgi:TATA-binding protein-associated factor
MAAVVADLLPRLSDPHCSARRAGTVEALHCLAEGLGLAVVPYIVLLVVPVLGAMSDHEPQVRLLATSTFAALVRLMPLDSGPGEPEGLSTELRERKEKKVFLAQLLDSRKAEQYRISVPVKAELRSWSWLPSHSHLNS